MKLELPQKHDLSHKLHVRQATTPQFRRQSFIWRKNLTIHEIENYSDKGFEFFPTEPNIGMQGVQELFFCELKVPGGSSTYWTLHIYIYIYIYIY